MGWYENLGLGDAKERFPSRQQKLRRDRQKLRTESCEYREEARNSENGKKYPCDPVKHKFTAQFMKSEKLRSIDENRVK